MSLSTNHLSGVPGILSASDVALTASHLASLQVTSGQIPWFPGGHCDPWNHVEAAMALTITGYQEEARAAYRWLAATQLGDGSWFNYYLGGSVKDTRLDTNVCAYVATGIYHYLLATGDVDFTNNGNVGYSPSVLAKAVRQASKASSFAEAETVRASSGMRRSTTGKRR